MTISTTKLKPLDNTSFLLVGRTGSGKSHLIHAILTRLEAKYSPNELKYALFDLKHSEFTREAHDYKQDYLRFGIVTDPGLALERLEYLSRIADMRLRMHETEPLIFIYIEECDAAYEDQERFDKSLLNILDKVERANMQLVYATSRGSDPKAVSDKLLNAFDKIVAGSLSRSDADRFGVKPEANKQFDFRIIIRK